MIAARICGLACLFLLSGSATGSPDCGSVPDDELAQSVARAVAVGLSEARAVLPARSSWLGAAAMDARGAETRFATPSEGTASFRCGGAAAGYLAFQQAMSRFVRDEQRRPTVRLSLLGSSPVAACIIGGTGPVSDAYLLAELAQLAREAHAGRAEPGPLLLVSAPPPRSPSQLGWGRTAAHAIAYLSTVGALLHDSDELVCSSYVLASNTAHLTLRAVLGSGVAPLVAPSRIAQLRERVVDVVELVAEAVAAAPAETRSDAAGSRDGRGDGASPPVPDLDAPPLPQRSAQAIVMGTAAAYARPLYPPSLRARGATVAAPPSSEQVALLQLLIDRTKQGVDAAACDCHAFVRLLLTLLAAPAAHGASGAPHVLLACTELPMLLRACALRWEAHSPLLCHTHADAPAHMPAAIAAASLLPLPEPGASAASAAEQQLASARAQHAHCAERAERQRDALHGAALRALSHTGAAAPCVPGSESLHDPSCLAAAAADAAADALTHTWCHSERRGVVRALLRLLRVLAGRPFVVVDTEAAMASILHQLAPRPPGAGHGATLSLHAVRDAAFLG